MTDIEWTPETLVALVFTVLFALTADYEAAGHALKVGAKKAGCGVLVTVTLGQKHCEKVSNTRE